MHFLFSRIFSFYSFCIFKNSAARLGRLSKNLKLRLCLVTQAPLRGYQFAVDAAEVVLEGGVAREQSLAEDAFKRLELHVDAGSVIFEMRNGLESLATILNRATERSHALSMGQKMILQVLLLLERFFTALKRAPEQSFVAFKVPSQLALADELTIEADWALKL